MSAFASTSSKFCFKNLPGRLRRIPIFLKGYCEKIPSTCQICSCLHHLSAGQTLMEGTIFKNHTDTQLHFENDKCSHRPQQPHRKERTTQAHKECPINSVVGNKGKLESNIVRGMLILSLSFSFSCPLFLSRFRSACLLDKLSGSCFHFCARPCLSTYR